MGRAGVMLAAILGACSFEPDAVAIATRSDAVAPPDDGPAGDGEAPSPDGPADAVPDARTCTDLPAGCSEGASFTCGTTCFALCETAVASWDVAEGRCVGWGGHLARLGDGTTTGTCVQPWLDDQTLAGDVWIGLYQEASSPSPMTGWRWANGGVYAYANWRTGQPDDNTGPENNQENCADAELDWAWDWNDGVCTDAQAYLCAR